MSSRESHSSHGHSYRHRTLTGSSSRSWDPSLQSSSDGFQPSLLQTQPQDQRNLPSGFAPRGQLTQNRLSGYEIPGSDAYLTAQMAHNPQHYSWQSQPPVLRSPISMDQSLPHPHSLSPGGFPMGYGQQGGAQSYFPPTGPSAQYLSPIQPGVSHQPHGRSHSPGGSPPALPDQSFVSPPPSYLLNQSNYYLPETSLPSHTSSIPVSPHPPAPLPSETLYSSPESAQASSDPEHQVRVISFRPRPQCWDHGCNGREFSTFSNLLRHQREKSGVVAKAECPMCGAAFTRTTARNIHVAQGKCKGAGGSGRESSNEQYYS
ncbi:hypothetical protein ASPWEDRAFT_32782 [Aspergillus wentii DTO 134E9]|uniref:C2H2-type domain-containing protein n=1 Tax=Aspergillus wentii DTO 134E9 TaxID=1073089 RepID=A0A1L9R6T2_ASPWE|nr:uncharacterized protein ASPWEDRAFT_32782 [Aspergillus wentii DTO 134E9]OJJ30620.1 hypothetical protein ASPWEDRAFT_32782 [Aspergillus wentii DTO 134E9]